VLLDRAVKNTVNGLDVDIVRPKVANADPVSANTGAHGLIFQQGSNVIVIVDTPTLSPELEILELGIVVEESWSVVVLLRSAYVPLVVGADRVHLYGDPCEWLGARVWLVADADTPVYAESLVEVFGPGLRVPVLTSREPPVEVLAVLRHGAAVVVGVLEFEF